MKIKKQLKKIITKLVEVSFKDGKMVESQVTKSIKVLKLLPKYDAILALSEFLKELKRLERKHTIFIETSIPLLPAHLKKIKKIMDKRVKITKVVAKINPEILGGFKLRVGDEIWDDSLVGKINQVKEAIVGGRSN